MPVPASPARLRFARGKNRFAVLSTGIFMFDRPTSIGHTDLDGDGRSDLITTWTDLTVDRSEFAGEVWVWYGADLEAEWQARHPVTRSGP